MLTSRCTRPENARAEELNRYFLGGFMESIPDDLRLFIYDITLFLQKHSNYNPEKIEPMFQRAYKLYVKYDVENNNGDDIHKA